MAVKSWMGVFLLSLALLCTAAAEVTKLDPDLELEELRPGLFLHRAKSFRSLNFLRYTLVFPLYNRLAQPLPPAIL